MLTSIRILIDGVGSRGFGVTGRGGTGGSLTTNKDDDRAEVVLSSVEGVEHDTD